MKFSIAFHFLRLINEPTRFRLIEREPTLGGLTVLVSLLTHPVQTIELGEHFKKLNIVHPTPECGDIWSDGINIDALCAEDDAVLPLVGRDFNCPIDNDIESLFVNRLAVILIIALAGIHNELIQLSITNVIMIGI